MSPLQKVAESADSAGWIQSALLKLNFEILPPVLFVMISAVGGWLVTNQMEDNQFRSKGERVTTERYSRDLEGTDKQINKLETRQQSILDTVTRTDERVKGIQDDVSQLRHQ